MEAIDAGSRGSRRYGTYGVGLVACGAALVLYGASSSSSSSGRGATTLVESGVSHQSSSGLDWSVYKFTIPVGNGSTWDLFRLANATLGPTEISGLGCGGVRASATLLGEKGPQIHWVEAAHLSNDARPVDEWEAIWTELNGDLSEWNGFMHNKATMFTDDLGPMVEALRSFEPKMPLMYRKTSGYAVDAAEHPDWTGGLGHVMFPIRGRIYEVVGPLTTMFEAKFDTASWAEFSAAECPEAHRLDDDLSHYAKVFGAYNQGNAESNAGLVAWSQDKGFWPPMLVAVAQTASDDLFEEILGDGKLSATLKNLSGTTFGATYAADGHCAVAYTNTVATWTNFKLPVKYVKNDHAFAYPAGSSPTNFGRYVSETHKTVTGSYDDWAGWDHWLDQHVGLKYKEYENEAACEMVQTLNDALVVNDLPVGQREEDDEIHYYVGYDGPLTWEYAVDPFFKCLSGATRNNGADICTCRADNNDVRYLEDTGSSCTNKGGSWGDSGGGP